MRLVATSFASAFYQALAHGRNVSTAFKLGCNQIDMESLDEQDTPHLLAQRADPAQVLFGFAPEDDWIDYRLENAPRFLAPIAQACESRRVGDDV